MIEVCAVAFSLILARVATFITLLPIFGGDQIPRMVKLGLAIALAVAWFDFSAVDKQQLLASASEVSWLSYGLALGREALLGAVLSYTLGLLLVPARVAGEFLTQQMGLTLGNTIDPTAATSTGSITQIFEALAILLFLGLDGHHLFLTLLHTTFARWPVGGPFTLPPIGHFVTTAAGAEEMGLVLVAPLGVCLFLTTIVLALMARAAPQINIFSVGFALQIGVGLAAMVLLLPNLLRGMVNTFGHFTEYLAGLG